MQWHDLYTACPASFLCSVGGVFYWRCACGAALEINEKAYIRCKNGHKHAFCNVRWRCPRHNDYKAADVECISGALWQMIRSMYFKDHAWFDAITKLLYINLNDIKDGAPENYAARDYKNYDPILNDDDDEKKIDYVGQIEKEIRSIKLQPTTSRKKIFDIAKKTYKQQGKPVIIDADNTLKKIKRNASNYKNVALPLTLAQDKPFNTWNEQQFKQDFSRRFNIPIECIQILSVKAGSTIIDIRINTHWKDNYGRNKSMGIEVIADRIDSKKAEKAFVEFAIFAVEFKPPEAGFDCSRLKVIMNPKWNRAYGPGATNWDGPLNDGKSRGNEPYYCPKGWKRFAVQFEEEALDFAGTYDKWPIAYHGTKFKFSMMITLSGLKCFGGYHGTGVYLSPSIKYVSHPRYCKPIELKLKEQELRKQNIKQEQINEFKKYDGKWVQCAFMCRIKPGSYRKCKETMGSWMDDTYRQKGVFDNIDIKTIEWVVDGKSGEIIGNEKILIYGIMIRARDTEQTGYSDY